MQQPDALWAGNLAGLTCPDSTALQTQEVINNRRWARRRAQAAVLGALAPAAAAPAALGLHLRRSHLKSLSIQSARS